MLLKTTRFCSCLGLIIQQNRSNTVNFFQRRTGDVLWKTVTAVSPSGRMRGRLKTRQPLRRLKPLYNFAMSPMGVKFPGLNATLSLANSKDPIYIVEQTDEEKENALKNLRQNVEKVGTKRKRFKREKLHPMERGFSGSKIVGQKLGAPPSYDDVEMSELQSTCLELRRTCAMSGAFGRVFSTEALIFVGNGKGLGGYAVGISKANDSVGAIIRAQKTASKRLFYVELLENRTIYQDFFAECNCTRIYAMRVPRGYGLHCHPRLIKICQLLGIKDLYAKVESGSGNYIALTQAFITGLLNQENHQQLAEKARLHVVELSNLRQYYPKVVASPLCNTVKTEEDMTETERLRLDEFYGEGRMPLKKEPKPPIYINTSAHIHAEWKKFPFRNMEKRMIRLLADGEVERWTRKNRNDYGEKLHKMALAGEYIIPEGIGLPRVHSRED